MADSSGARTRIAAAGSPGWTVAASLRAHSGSVALVSGVSVVLGEVSGIDFLVQFAGQLDLAKFFRLKEDLGKLIGKEIDLSTDDMLRPEIRADVLADAIAL